MGVSISNEMAFFRSSTDKERERAKGRADWWGETFKGERGEREGETDEGSEAREEAEPCDDDDDDDDDPDIHWWDGAIHLQ
jgi:hypothetical protein